MTIVEIPFVDVICCGIVWHPVDGIPTESLGHDGVDVWDVWKVREV